MKKRYVLKNKVRFYIFIATLFISMITVFSVTNAYGYKEPKLEVITLKNGDTLWGLAEKYNKKGDIREYIYDLKIINNLEDCDIIAGRELKIIIE